MRFVAMSRAAAAVGLLACLLVSGGCTYLHDENGQAVSLRTCDCMNVAPVEVPPAVEEQWIGPALTERIESRLAAGGVWNRGPDSIALRPMRLRVQVTEAVLYNETDCGRDGRRCRMACRITVEDEATGKALGGEDFTATCGRGGHSFLCGGSTGTGCGIGPNMHPLLDELADRIVQILHRAKGTSYAWESGRMGCGC